MLDRPLQDTTLITATAAANGSQMTITVIGESLVIRDQHQQLITLNLLRLPALLAALQEVSDQLQQESPHDPK